MRGNDLLDKMSLADPAFVEAADKKPVRKKHNMTKWAGLAATVALTVFAGLQMLPQKSPVVPPETEESQKETSDLPLIAITEHLADGAGFEGFVAYDISELVSSHPWTEGMKLTHLPVYKNTLEYTDSTKGFLSSVNTGQMQQLLLNVASGLGLNPDNLVISADSPALLPDGQTGYSLPYCLTTETKNLTIEVDETMTATILYKEPFIPLDQYDFSYYASYEDILSVADYLKKEYPNLTGWEDSQIGIAGGGYNIYQNQQYSLFFYEKGTTAAEEILNYHFRRITFYHQEAGSPAYVRVFSPDLSEKVGDYPIISYEEALNLLKNQAYITTVPYELTGQEKVAKTELVYRTASYEDYFMPYYRFFVEIPDIYDQLEEDGMKQFGVYYVPAVESKYISNLSLWDGRFN